MRHHRCGGMAIPKAPKVDGCLDARLERHGTLGEFCVGQHRSTRALHPSPRDACRDAVGLVFGNVNWLVHIPQLVAAGYAKPHKLLGAKPLALELGEGEVAQHVGAEYLLHVAPNVVAVAYVDSCGIETFARQSGAHHLMAVHGHVETCHAGEAMVAADRPPLLCHSGKRVGGKRVVAVHYEEKLSTGARHAHVYSHVLAPIVLVETGHGESIATALLEVCQHLVRVVGGAVVNGNPLKVLERLAQQAFKKARQQRRAVVYRCQYGYIWLVHCFGE